MFPVFSSLETFGAVNSEGVVVLIVRAEFIRGVETRGNVDSFACCVREPHAYMPIVLYTLE